MRFEPTRGDPNGLAVPFYFHKIWVQPLVCGRKRLEMYGKGFCEPEYFPVSQTLKNLKTRTPNRTNHPITSSVLHPSKDSWSSGSNRKVV